METLVSAGEVDKGGVRDGGAVLAGRLFGEQIGLEQSQPLAFVSAKL